MAKRTFGTCLIVLTFFLLAVCGGAWAAEGCNQPCNSGKPGVCGRGIVDCSGGEPVCKSLIVPGERLEVCNGEDDDCDGQADEGFDKDGDGFTTCGGDCDDKNPQVYPDAVERCDGKDNNCNGLIDDGFNVGGMCTLGQGECQRTGKRRCEESGISVKCDAVAGKPSAEVCDAKDNDCDGETDEGLGIVECGVGACRVTMNSCSAGGAARCVPGKPSEEVCGDGIDNDCNGRTDEGFEGVGKKCYMGEGACRVEGRFVCSDDKRSVSCDAVPRDPVPEICGNDIDDDCDGTVDDDTEGQGAACSNGLKGECSREGEMVCDRKKLSLACDAPDVSPQKEVCNGKDDDCDGEIDDGVTDECNGCGALPGKVGGECLATSGDGCSRGRWTCDAGVASGMRCEVDPKLSDGRSCAGDDNPCTLDTCSGGKCTHPNAADGAGCDDGNACTTDDVCLKGACSGGAHLACDDGNRCTEDSCDVLEGCVSKDLGQGHPNACGGCERLAAEPNSPCTLEEKQGVCREGVEQCQPGGGIACVQTVFAKKEKCDGADDDCDGEVDEGFGQTTCGIGACQVTVGNCEGGKIMQCTPKDPSPETCANMGLDDDCNGVVDDIAGLSQECPISVGSCIIPGSKKCVGEATAPVCVADNKDDVEDEDGDGIANYCEWSGSGAKVLGIEQGADLTMSAGLRDAGRGLFDVSRTRASMLPWQDTFDAIAIAPRSPDQAMILVSGSKQGGGGIAAIRAKDVGSQGPISFIGCDADVGKVPRRMVPLGDIADIVASLQDNYIFYPKIASQIPSAMMSKVQCTLRGELILASSERRWSEKGTARSCTVADISDIALLGDAPASIAGAVRCVEKSPSIWKKDVNIAGVDVLTRRADGVFEHSFAAIHSGTDEVSDLRIGRSGDASEFLAAFLAGGRRIIAKCSSKGGSLSCQSSAVEGSGTRASFAGRVLASAAHTAVIISDDGSCSQFSTGDIGGKLSLQSCGRVLPDGAKSSVHGIAEFPAEKGRPHTLVVDADGWIGAAAVKQRPDGGLMMKAVEGARYLPESESEGIQGGGKLGFARPHSMVFVTFKHYAGVDMFAAFDIMKGSKIGEMGFFFWNANEWPVGTFGDVSFDGKEGAVKFSFEDPAGDPLIFRASIRAKHGGSLMNWIDELKNQMLKFSVKGDASAVGLWPVTIRVEASDPGGLTSISSMALSRDGTVESITDTAVSPK